MIKIFNFLKNIYQFLLCDNAEKEIIFIGKKNINKFIL